MFKISEIKPEVIKIIYKENFSKINTSFLTHQSEFMTGIYERYYKDLETANIVLYFAKRLHQSILRQREMDLNYDISFNGFYENHKKLNQNEFKVIDVARHSGLPRETVRRKINELIKFKVLKKNNQKITWDPLMPEKITYNILVKKNIHSLAKLIRNVLIFFDKEKSLKNIEEEIEKNYSFYWYHYLNTQQKFFKNWQKNMKDLELLLIGLECSILGAQELSKQKYNFDEVFSKKINDQKDCTVSASSISNLTGIPRATCIRKLSKLINYKLIKKDARLRRYYFDFKNYGNSVINSKQSNAKVIDLYSEFFHVIIRALCRKID
jgi:Fic family protein